MNRAKLLAWRDRIAALGRGFVALVTMLAVVAPSVAWAGVPYSIHWFFTQENPTCEHARLEPNGDAFFRVNETPLPTHEVPGAFATHDDGSESNIAEAGFDSVLLRMRANDFRFGAQNAGGDDSCVHSHSVVHLISVPLGLNKPLFDVRRDGTAFEGATELDLSLSEINPPLARDIVELVEMLAAVREELFERASQLSDLAAQESLLQELDTELRDLVTRPLDEIAQTDLDAILDRYSGVVDPAVREALKQVIDDLKQSVTELENELASLIDNFGAQADATADLATAAAREAGWNPDESANYGLGAGDVPWVEVPDISDVPGAWSASDNPYAAYADGVIEALEAGVRGGRVVARADFVANVRAWRANDAALERALRQRAGVSQAETNAFLDAQLRVTGYVRRFMDASDWFVDSPATAQLRGHVDGVLKRAFDDLADQMKDSLNLLPAGGFDLTRTQLFQTIDAFAGAMSAIGDGAQAYADVMGTLVHATSRIGVGFVPFVGPALDLCEMVTGKAWCLPSGQALSDEERIFSGIGFGIAGAGPAMYRGMKTSGGLRPAAMRVAGEIEEIDEFVARALRAPRRTWFKTLRGAVTSKPLDDFEKKVAKFMLDDGRSLLGVGDDGVRKMLGIPTTSTVRGQITAADFLTVTQREKLVLSEAKSGVEIDTNHVIDQLTNPMKKLKEKGLTGDVGRVELMMQQGARSSNRNHVVRDGYLFDLSKGKTVTLEGFRNFIMVIRL